MKKNTHPQPWFDQYTNHNPKQAVAIIGGGISGASCAYSLAKRGYKVTIFEKNSALATEASGNPQGMLYANFFGNHLPSLELSVLGYKYSHFLINQLLQPKIDFDNCGIIQLGYNPKIIQQQTKLINSKPDFDDLFKYVDNNTIKNILGTQLHSLDHGLYFPYGLWVNPVALVKALTTSPNITVKCNTKIDKLVSLDNFSWVLVDSRNLHTKFSNVVICNSFYATEFMQLNKIHLRKIRGQISIINQINSLKSVLCNNGYITPSVDNSFIIGATFKFKHLDDKIKDTENTENLNNFRNIIPEIISNINPKEILAKVAFRSSTTDYIPLVGPIARYTEFMNDYKNLKKDANYWIETPCPYHMGIFLSLAHGSKGLLTAPISGEIIASYIDNQKPNISNDLRVLLHPNRLFKKELVKPLCE